MKRGKLTKFYKIKLLYASKIKSNALERNIRKKTHNLTEHCARNYSTYRLIKAFHFAFRKLKVRSLSENFFLFPRQNLDFKHSLGKKMSIKEEESKIFKD